MKLKSFAAVALACATIVACSDKKQEYPADYTLTVVADEDNNGTMVYLSDFDSGQAMDSAVVTDGKAVFTGSIDQAKIVSVAMGQSRPQRVILEGGDVELKDGRAISSLNDKINAIYEDYTARRDSLLGLIGDEMTETEQEAVYTMAQAHLDSVWSKAMLDNIYNPIGYMLLLQQATDMGVDEFEKILTDYPHMSKYTRIDKIKKSFDARKATSAGYAYTDFTFEQDGTEVSLSEYVKPGTYTLVDFWASWCGPCRREIEIVKELYAKYHDKGLNVVGVAVWEDPEATRTYLADNPIPWDILCTGEGSTITDLYGINGIPCIILIGPDGNIIARDLFDDDLVNTVANALDA